MRTLCARSVHVVQRHCPCPLPCTELPVDKSPLVLRPVTKRINRPKSSLLGRRSLRSTGYEVVQTYRGLSPKKGPHSSPVPVEMVRQQLPFAAGPFPSSKAKPLSPHLQGTTWAKHHRGVGHTAKGRGGS